MGRVGHVCWRRLGATAITLVLVGTTFPGVVAVGVCLGAIDGLDVSPSFWTTRGGVLAVNVHVADQGPFLGPNYAPMQTRVHLRANASDGALLLDVRSPALVPPFTFRADIAIPKGAAPGRGNITAVLEPEGNLGCIPLPGAQERSWGFVVDDRPDLTPAGYDLVSHFHTGRLPFNPRVSVLGSEPRGLDPGPVLDLHLSTFPRPRANFTRYGFTGADFLNNFTQGNGTGAPLASKSP